VVGSKKSVTCDLSKQTVTLNNIRIEKKGEILKAVDEGSSAADVKFEEPLKLELKDFIECVQTGRTPSASSQAALRGAMIADKALESARLKRSVKIDEIE
jgi:predicted dehydrogenase